MKHSKKIASTNVWNLKIILLCFCLTLILLNTPITVAAFVSFQSNNTSIVTVVNLVRALLSHPPHLLQLGGGVPFVTLLYRLGGLLLITYIRNEMCLRPRLYLHAESVVSPEYPFSIISHSNHFDIQLRDLSKIFTTIPLQIVGLRRDVPTRSVARCLASWRRRRPNGHGAHEWRQCRRWMKRIYTYPFL